MASTLDKYGVPLPSGANRAMSQPKMKNRFRVVTSNFGINSDDKDYMALETDNVSRPKLSFLTATAHMHGHNTTYVVGENWEPITLVIRDSTDNSATRALSRQLQKQRDFGRRISDKSQQSYSSYKFNMYLQTLSGENPVDSVENLATSTLQSVATALTGNSSLVSAASSLLNVGTVLVPEYFYCTGCMITDVDYGSFDYSTGQPVTITITIKPDNVTQYNNAGEMFAETISTGNETVDDALTILNSLFS